MKTNWISNFLLVAIAAHLPGIGLAQTDADHPKPLAAKAIGDVEPPRSTAQPPQRFSIDLTTHDSIEIDCPAAAIWPHLLEPNPWTPMDLLHRDGPAGAVGERFAVFNPELPKTVRTFGETVELIPNRRRTLKFYDLNGRLGGYVVWTLNEVRGRTVVSYDMYFESILADSDMRGTDADSVRTRQHLEQRDLTKKRIQFSLLALKRLVESQ